MPKKKERDVQVGDLLRAKGSGEWYPIREIIRVCLLAYFVIATPFGLIDVSMFEVDDVRKVDWITE